MDIKRILIEQKRKTEIDNELLKELKNKTNYIVGLLEEQIRKQKINADIFIGGSFAKSTLVKQEEYDIDIFVRFDWKIEDISNVLEKIVKGTDLKAEKLHGSRDYFRIYYDNMAFEIVPVYKIKKPQEARNVTDLSYFHVNYVKKKLRKTRLASDILLAKSFCQAHGVYGAESYINGFSGYGLECLIINCGSFLKVLKELVKIKIGGGAVLDPERHYQKKNNVLFSLNEARLKSPIILVDPTWKERNVLAALNKETFLRFQNASRRFLKKPSLKFFEKDNFNEEKLRKIAKNKKAEFLHIEVETDRQEGDIAGTKMKKYSRFLEFELLRYFDIIEREFIYNGGKKADFYLVVKPKEKAVVYGPPIEMKKHAWAFKKRHKNFFEKDGRLYSEIKVDFSGWKFLERFGKDNKTKIKEMGIVEMRID